MPAKKTYDVSKKREFEGKEVPLLFCRVDQKGCGKGILIVRQKYTTTAQSQRGWLRNNTHSSALTAIHLDEMDAELHEVVFSPPDHQIRTHRLKLEERCAVRRGVR